MSIVYICSSLPPEVASYPWSPPSWIRPLPTEGDGDGATEQEQCGTGGLCKYSSHVSDTLAPGLGTHFGAEGVLSILKHTTQVSASSSEYAKIMS